MGSLSSKKKPSQIDPEKLLFLKFTEESKHLNLETKQQKIAGCIISHKRNLMSLPYEGLGKSLVSDGLMRYYLTCKPHLIIGLDSSRTLKNQNI